MRRLLLLTLAVVAGLSLAGCPGFFGTNYLKALDPVSSPKATDYQGADGLAKLKTDLGSPAVVDQLVQSGEVGKIKDDLKTEYLNKPISPDPTVKAEQQDAAVLYADLSLKTTPAADTINNITALLQNSGSGIDTDKPLDVVKQILPDDVKKDKAAFAEMISGFVDANSAYEKLGQSITDSTDAPQGVDMNDVAEKAFVSVFVAAAQEAAVSASGGNQDAANDLLFSALVDQDPTAMEQLGSGMQAVSMQDSLDGVSGILGASDLSKLLPTSSGQGA